MPETREVPAALHHEILALYAAMEADPNDWDLRSVTADWFEEHGDADMASCLRWCERERRRPLGTSGREWTWFNEAQFAAGGSDGASNVPEDLYSHLEGGTEDRDWWRDYPTLHEADRDLCGAMLKLKEG